MGFLLLTAPAFAADVYSFIVDQQGGTAFSSKDGIVIDDSAIKGTVVLEGRKYRAELAPDPDSPRPYQAVISKDGGEHEIALNLQSHTFYEPPAATLTSSLLHLFPVGDGTVSNVKLDTVEAPAPETVAGIQARRHEIRLSYDITIVLPPPGGAPGVPKGRSETVRGKVKVDAIYWLAEGRTPALPRLLRPEISTGFAEIDPRLAAAIAALQGIPVKQQVTITTEGDQSTEPQTSVRTAVLQNHKTQESKASLFEIPSGFKRHEPEMARPGMGALPPR
jgi:hypothetical protein